MHLFNAPKSAADLWMCSQMSRADKRNDYIEAQHCPSMNFTLSGF